MKKPKYVLNCPAGSYSSDSMLSLAVAVLRHRCWHLFRHGRWAD